MEKIVEVAIDLWRVYRREVTVGGSTTVLDAVAARDVEVLEQMADCVVVNFMWADRVLRTPDNHIPNVRACRDQGVNDLTDTTAVAEAHPRGQLLLLHFIWVADTGEEGLDERGLAGKGGHLDGAFPNIHPSGEMLCRHTGDICVD